MKPALTIVIALALVTPAFAQSAGDMKGMPGMPAAGTEADGVGVVTAVDTKAGTVTIHHSPIAKLNWPAMTMTFEATPPSLLQGIKSGQSVTFALMQMGGSTTLTAIQPK
jgi:Cu(I)/Ag(I) efflux system protein CusF